MKVKAKERRRNGRLDGDLGDASTPRKRRNGNDPSLRYILIKPEPGHEVASEGEPLIEAFKNC